MRPSRITDDWRNTAKIFYEIWNLLYCIRTMNGKHVSIKVPMNSGCLYYNYKGFFGILLMAICDARYVFSFIDIGDYGSNNDSGVFCKSVIGK